MKIKKGHLYPFSYKCSFSAPKTRESVRNHFLLFNDSILRWCPATDANVILAHQCLQKIRQVANVLGLNDQRVFDSYIQNPLWRQRVDPKNPTRFFNALADDCLLNVYMTLGVNPRFVALDYDDWTRHYWWCLHFLSCLSVDFGTFMPDIALLLPCNECRKHCREYWTNSSGSASRAFTFDSVIAFHNAVNARLGKPQFSLAESQAYWTEWKREVVM